jgi:signal transduction histidine kinase
MYYERFKYCKTRIKRNAVNVKLNFSKTADIECYPSQLNQVFLNIIINSVQAVGENGNVEINLYEKIITSLLK